MYLSPFCKAQIGKEKGENEENEDSGEGCVFRDNRNEGNGGSAFLVSIYATLNIIDVLMEKNTGTAIFNSSAVITIEGGIFRENSTIGNEFAVVGQ